MLVSSQCGSLFFYFFFFNDTATTEIYTLSLHDALPISSRSGWKLNRPPAGTGDKPTPLIVQRAARANTSGLSGSNSRSEEHTSELQSQSNLVCRLLLEKKKKKTTLRVEEQEKLLTTTTI